MRVLVTGGAGYIGSQMARQLLERKIDVVVADSLENGHRAALTQGIALKVGNLGDKEFLHDLFAHERFDAVMHFAGYIETGESVLKPGKYFSNNVANTVALLEAMRAAEVRQFIFSSTAGVYGNPAQVPMPESLTPQPINPYGESKWMVERILARYDTAFELRSISLRYFNAAGASSDGRFGEDHPNESHIIPLVIRAALSNQTFHIFGEDYPTPDGTCIRDYIHVADLGEAHLVALDALMNRHATAIFNVGTGRGYSNREIVEAVHKHSGREFKVQVAPRRAGDPNELVADATRLKKELGWTPRRSDLDTIIQTAWKWHSSHPKGYDDR